MPKIEDAPDAMNKIMEEAYQSAIKDGKTEEDAAKIAMAAAKKAGWHKDGSGMWKMMNSSALETVDLNGIEIWSTGEYNGDRYEIADLDDMVSNHNEIGGKVKPYLKLGHDEGQELIQRDGYPSAGWVTNLKRIGEKLYADFKSIPAKLGKLIEAGAYARLSPEIYWNADFGDGKTRKRVLAAVSLLGANAPANMDLNDFVTQFYKLTNGELKSYIKLQESKMDEKEILALKAEIETLKQSEDKAKKYASELETKFKLAEEAVKKSEEEKFQASVDSAWKTYSGKKLLPAQEGIFKALCNIGRSELKVYSHQIGEGKKEEYSLNAIELVSKLVSGFEDIKIGGVTKYTDQNKAREAGAMTEDEILDNKTRNYILEQQKAGNKISYKDALLAVSKEAK